MLLTMPAPLFSLPLPFAARHGRTLIAVVGAVLLAHWLVLGQPLTWKLDWAPSGAEVGSAEEGPTAATLQTRTHHPEPAGTGGARAPGIASANTGIAALNPDGP